MFKKEDDSFFYFVDTIQKIVIFLIVASIVAGIFMFCFIGVISGILLAVILPVILIVLSMMFNAICYIAIDAKIARNKALGEDYEYLTDMLLKRPSKKEENNPNQKYIDAILNSKQPADKKTDDEKKSR